MSFSFVVFVKDSNSAYIKNYYPIHSDLCYVTAMVPGQHTWNPTKPTQAGKRLLTMLYRTKLRPRDPLGTGS